MTATNTEPRPRSRWPIRRIHKWMSVTVGFVVLIWLVSGLVMIAYGEGGGGGPRTAIDFSVMVVSPAEASRIGSAALRGARVRSVAIRRLLDRLAYNVWTDSGTVVIDAATGAVVTFTPDLAGRLALEGLPAGSTIEAMVRIDRASAGYAGPLPAFRVDVADGRGTRAYVNATTGEVQRRSRAERMRAFLTSLHGFGPINALPHGNRARQLALWLTSLVGIGVALTGYWMALPRPKRQPS